MKIRIYIQLLKPQLLQSRIAQPQPSMSVIQGILYLILDLQRNILGRRGKVD